MKRFFILFAALAVMAGFSAYAQDAAVKKIIEMGQTDNQVMHHLDILLNRFGGRPVGSAAYENAQQWIKREFESWGIEVTLEEAGSVPVGFNRDHWQGRLIGENSMELHFATPSFTSGTHGVQRGHVVLEPTNDREFESMKGRLKGAWVLVSGNSSGWPIGSYYSDSLRNAVKEENRAIQRRNMDKMRQAHESGSRERPEMEPMRELPGLYYKEMVEAGVLGFIQSAEVPIRALYDRKMLNDPDNCSFDTLPTVPDIKLDENQFAVIKKMAQERRDFQLEFDIRNHFSIGPVPYKTLIGSIKGSKYPDEYVIVSCHLDSYDVATGGIDCGTGVGPMMEVARMIALSGAKPKRTILFIAFAAEEFGLLGAEAWVKAHPDKLDKISNMFNRDGGPLPPVGISVPEAMYDDFVKICEPISQIRSDYPFEVRKANPRPKPTQTGGTDATVFALHGVPTYEFECRDFKGYGFEYQEIWHTERDTYSKEIPEYQEQAATVTAIVALGVANLDHQLSREGMYLKPGEEPKEGDFPPMM